ncbi:FAD-dependent oxidoreductase [Catenovulum adriaticum]|uniref:NADPH-dependent 2,4-dienoyl-CoA reductase n=1 Tax=Catenovulum adriaticum TaxID=2984846 RepID=A0ABY7AP48_9ALTE|nr:NADPH-dependent 2,4-dienoyl-CoA reductase [Catenovulum sp. TS8]WAJ70497.1 NADPH-dependent 2,4-dienoyl-CoA reductase [Catenovulum sp. TS8]
MSYPHLFSPLKLAHWQLSNRVVMGSMHTNLEEADNGFTKLAQFYKERVNGGVGLIVTGGISPNKVGALAPKQALMATAEDADKHRQITESVHQAGGLICMQILHAGRYGFHSAIVAPSAIQAPINPFIPHELTSQEVDSQIDDYVNAAKLAQQAGYDGVEIMGSEGYLINQFLVKRTNQRKDKWGGDFNNRCRFALEIIKRIRVQVGEQFILIYRLSMLDLVEDGATFDEVIRLAKQVEALGVDLLNSGIGWHETRIPTIAAMVPRATFAQVSRQVKQHVNIPIITSNRINMPDTAEQVLANGCADLVSMARPFLADSEWVNKAKNHQTKLINTCIACNQACLDQVFEGKLASCLVNPRAAHETELNFEPTKQPKKIAVVGGGAAGMAFSIYAAQRGHQISLFEQQSELGGQLNFAKKIPGKSEFYEMLRYFKNSLALHNVKIFLDTCASSENLADFDEVVLATGVIPRAIALDGASYPKVVSYADILSEKVKPANSVAIIGAGGIGFDVAEYVSQFNTANVEPRAESDIAQFAQQWGIDLSLSSRAGLKRTSVDKSGQQANKTIYLLQRKSTKVGAGLAKTTGWIHKAELNQQGVKMLNEVEYQKVDEQGLHILIGKTPQILAVDQVIVCAGQESLLNLSDQIVHQPVHIIGGAYKAAQLDAKSAIKQAAILAASI